MMWELIRANKRRSIVLVVLMLLLLALLGFVIGVAVFPGMAKVDVGDYYIYVPAGGLVGLGVAVLLWSVQATAAYFGGGAILMASSKARPIQKEDHPMLFNIVEEMTIAARLPKMPKIYIIDDMSMNAFAAGRGPDDAMVAVTAGLLGRMNRDQLQGVIAHEISHIVHRDVLFMTMIGVMVGTVVILSELFLRSVFYGIGSSRRYSGRGSRRGGGGGRPDCPDCLGDCAGHCCTASGLFDLFRMFPPQGIPGRCRGCGVHPLSRRPGVSAGTHRQTDPAA